MSKNDETIKLLLNKVEEQKKNLGNRPKVSLQTNGVFKFDSNEYFNINATNDKNTLAFATASLLRKEYYYKEALKKLGLEDEPYTWNSYTVDEWIQDFKSKIELLKWQENDKKLKATQKKLNDLISEEAKTELEIDKIKESLGI